MRLFWILIVLLQLSQYRAEGQVNFQYIKNSLDPLLQNGKKSEYFLGIQKWANRAADTLVNQTLLDSIGELLYQDFGVLTKEETKLLRYIALKVASKYNSRFGNYEKALEFYLFSHQLVEDKEYLDENAWYAENEIYNIYTRRGDYEKADAFGRSVEKSLIYYIHNSDQPDLFIGRLSRFYANRGINSRSEGDGMKSFLYFKKGLDLADSISFNTGLQANAIGLVEYYIDSSQFSLADSYLQLADSTLHFIQKDPRYKVKKAELLYQEAQLYNKQGHTENNKDLITKSLPLYRVAIDTLNEYYRYKKRREFAKYYTPLANAYLELDMLLEAENAINQGLSSIIPDYNHFEKLPGPEQIYYETSFVELFKTQSQLFRKKYLTSGDLKFLELGLQSITLGLLAIDIIREEVIAEPSKLIAIQQNKIMTHMGLELDYELYIKNHDELYFNGARKLFNRSKALLLDERVRQHRLIDQMSSEDSLSTAQMQSKMRELHSLLFEEGMALDSLNGLILELQVQIDSIMGKYGDTNLEVFSPMNYMEYSIHGEDIYILASWEAEEGFLILQPKTEFMKLLSRLNDFLGWKGLSEDATIQSDLYDFLIAPLDMDLPEHLVVIPDGEIGYIPFDMLRDPMGKLIIENTTISYAYEYQSYESRDVKEVYNYQIFCMAPSYDKINNGKEEETRGSLFDLPYARVELDSIKNLFGASALISSTADKESLMAGNQVAGIFHFTGHAIVDKDKAFLAFSSDENDKSHMTPQEIALMSQAADLVVLSACETGLGKLELGEGVRSLGRSFIEAGSSSIVISLWNVNDKSTSQVMTAFYRYLNQGSDIDESLRKAKLSYISTAGKINRDPYYWAGFIPAGDMKNRIRHE